MFRGGGVGDPFRDCRDAQPIRRQVTSNFGGFAWIGGWFFTYGLSFLGRIPSLGAAVEKGGAVWMLGVMLGLRAAIMRRDPKG